MTRIRFERRVLGVATAQTLHLSVEVHAGEVPAVGDLVAPDGQAPARVLSIRRFGQVPEVVLEPIDVSHGERHLDEEIEALRSAGWRT